MYFVCIMFPQLHGVDYTTCHTVQDSSSQLHPMKSWNTSPIIIMQLIFFEQLWQKTTANYRWWKLSLYRSFSFILYNTDEKHLYLCQDNYCWSNCSKWGVFQALLPSDTVTEHAGKIWKATIYVWGTQAEIFAFSVLVDKSIFVATIKQSATYYWAKHMCTSKFSPFKFTPPSLSLYHRSLSCAC